MKKPVVQYLITGYWRGALNIGQMRLFNNVQLLKNELSNHFMRSYYAKSDDYDTFLKDGCYRVYELTTNLNAGPRLIRGSELKELINA